MAENTGDAFGATLASEVEKLNLPDISGKYEPVKRLGSGANDTAYLISSKNSGDVFVALTPLTKITEFGWRKTSNKVDKVTLLDDLGLSQHAVHKIETGTMYLDKIRTKEPVAVVEYGGVPIESAIVDQDKIEILNQVWKITKTLNNNGYAINDFKHDHWVYQKDDDGKIVVRLIDYTQVWKLPQESLETGANDHRRGDIRSFTGLVKTLFPWFSPTVIYWEDKFSDLQNKAEMDLARLVEENARFGKAEKGRRQLINLVKEKFGRY